MSLRHRLTALFSPHRRWLAPEVGRVQAGGPFGPREAVVPRRACTHFRLPLPALAAAGRAAALDLAVRRVAPGPEPRYAAVWQGGVAQVWVLDAQAAADARETERLVAESSLLPAPAQPDGVRLLAVAGAVEGQAWREGQLVASRCWPAPPSPAAWALFLRAAGLPAANDGPPPLEAPAPAAQPWGQPTARWRWAPAQLEAAFWRGSALLLGLLLGWPLVAALLWGSASAWQAQRLAELREASAPLIAAREQAEQAQARLDALARLAAGPVDAALLADLRERLPPEDRLLGWLRDGNRLHIELRAASADPRRYVQALAGHPLLAGVVANPGEAGRMQLDVELPLPEAAP